MQKGGGKTRGGGIGLLQTTRRSEEKQKLVFPLRSSRSLGGVDGGDPGGMLIEDGSASSSLRLTLLDLVRERSRDLGTRRKMRTREESALSSRMRKREGEKTHSDVVVSF